MGRIGLVNPGRRRHHRSQAVEIGNGPENGPENRTENTGATLIRAHDSVARAQAKAVVNV